MILSGILGYTPSSAIDSLGRLLFLCQAGLRGSVFRFFNFSFYYDKETPVAFSRIHNTFLDSVFYP